MLKVLLASFLFITSLASNAETRIPAFQGDVLDETHTFSSSELQDLKLKIRQLRDEHHVWMAIYFSKDLKETTIEDLANRTFSEWKLGEKGKDNGLLFVAVPSARKMRLEVGYGLEATLTDAWTKRLQMQILVPAFQVRKYYAGMSDALSEIGRRFSNPNDESPPKRKRASRGLSPIIIPIFFLLFIGLQIFFYFMRRSSRGYDAYPHRRFPRDDSWSSPGPFGGGGGDSSSSGGGSSGGGGSSSDW